jgi:hypothetical protein
VALRISGPANAERLEIETRLRAELAIAGFEAEVLDESVGADVESLEGAAQSTGSFAAIGVVRTGELDAEVWVTDRVTGKALLRHVRFDVSSPDAAAIFAIRAVELLRASLLELSESHPSRGEMRAASAVRTWVSRPQQRASSASSSEARAGAVLVAGPGGLPPSLAPSLGFSWQPIRYFWGGIDAWGPAFAEIERPEGRARIDQEAVTVAIGFEPRRIPPVSPFARLSGGGYRLGAQGHAAPPFTSATGQAWAALWSLGIGVRVIGPSSLELVSSLDAVLLAPRPVVEFGAENVGAGGRPSLVGGIAVGLLL